MIPYRFRYLGILASWHSGGIRLATLRIPAVFGRHPQLASYAPAVAYSRIPPPPQTPLLTTHVERRGAALPCFSSCDPLTLRSHVSNMVVRNGFIACGNVSVFNGLQRAVPSTKSMARRMTKVMTQSDSSILYTLISLDHSTVYDGLV